LSFFHSFILVFISIQLFTLHATVYDEQDIVETCSKQ